MKVFTSIFRFVFALLIPACASCAETNSSQTPPVPFYPPVFKGETQHTPPNEQQKLWALATCAVFTEMNQQPHDLTGFDQTLKNSIVAQASLSSGWNIHNRDDLLKTLEWIRTGGHRQKFDEIAKILSDDDPKKTEDLKKQAMSDSNFQNRIQVVQTYKDKFGAKSIIAWDFCRYIALCKQGYIVGYLTEDEVWGYIMSAARLLQNTFDSWEDLGENYVTGREFWSQGQGNSARWYYQKLLKDPESPWEHLPWDFDLSHE
jgi:hypothetical protein